MILITGATGKLGTSVVNQLQKLINKDQFIVTSSNVNGVEQLVNKGFNARLANFSDIDSLNDAFKGVTKLLLISTMDPNRLQQHKNVIDAAKSQNVNHLIYTSLAIKNIQTSGVKDLMISHFETEYYLKQSGLNYTIIRNTMYADALTQILGDNALHQSINLPGGDGKVPYALRREMGEATANLLVESGHENKIYNFTGSKSYSYSDIANELSILTGNTIAYKNISSDNLVLFLKEIGMPDFAIYLHVGTIQDIREKQYEIEEKTLEKFLHRPIASIQEFLKELFNI